MKYAPARALLVLAVLFVAPGAAETVLDIGPPPGVPDCFRFFRGPCLALPERR